MNILVVGGGGREDALVWKLSQSPQRPSLFCAPGNAGTRARATNVAIDADDLDALTEWAVAHRPDLVVIGPEAPLCSGLADRLHDHGLSVFGPTAAAARMEGSKAFAKEIMQAAGVPTAEARAFSDAAEALDHVRKAGGDVVIKADGLAAGKGVLMCRSVEEAESAVRATMVDRAFGAAGQTILVEEFLHGEEVSILALVDGERAVLLPSSQDHKRAFDNDEGPNTGGMGAYSPAPVIPDEDLPAIQSLVVDPILDELRARNIEYRGVLYAGLMVTADGPRVLEFNVRFGDPEAQCVLPRLKGDLVEIMQACVNGTLDASMLEVDSDACACVVMASSGYPGAYEKGRRITGLAKAASMPGVTVFHAGTAFHDGATVTDGGRVVGVTGRGPGLRDALDRAYAAVASVQWEGAQFRNDIGAKALSRLEARV